MGMLDLINHVLNFIAPACTVGCLLAWTAPWVDRALSVSHGRWAQALGNSLAGIVALGAGLWVFGHDGKMATYGAMVLAAASAQWLGARGWRKR